MNIMPVGIKMEGAKCLVIGGGIQAFDIAKNLVRCGAEVTVVSMEPCAKIKALDGIKLQEKSVDATKDAKGMNYIFCTLESPAICEEIAEVAKKGGTPLYCNAAPQHSNIVLPKLFAAYEGFSMAIFPGELPTKKNICNKVKGSVEQGYKNIACALKGLHETLNTLTDNPEKRKELAHFFVDSDFVSTLRADGFKEVRGKINEILGQDKKKAE